MGVVALENPHLERFLVRTRRQDVPDLFPLDEFLKDTLRHAVKFVPCEAASILLDDPWAKRSDNPMGARLHFVACLGERADRLIGTSVPAERGIAGLVYQTGQLYMTADPASDEHFFPEVDQRTGFQTRSLLAVPVVLERSICGVLELVNRVGSARFDQHDGEMIRVFGGYISSSFQNAVDSHKARSLVRRDHLTGLYNDRYLSAALRETIEDAGPERDTTVLFIDLDRFKNVNDCHGHLAGSTLLRTVGIKLLAALGDEGFACRFGGDEFVVVMPGAGPQAGVAMAESIRSTLRTIRRIEVMDDVGTLVDLSAPLTASVGVASASAHIDRSSSPADQAMRLLRMADDAMYKGKALGRDRVVMAESAHVPSR